MNLDYRVLASSSQSNCETYNKNEIAIDMGVSYTFLKNAINVQNIEFLFITHEHGDHTKVSTIDKLMKVNKHVIIITHQAVVDKILKKVKIDMNRVCIFTDLDSAFEFRSKTSVYSGKTFALKHDVPNFGIMFVCKNKKTNETTKVVRITDTGDLLPVSKDINLHGADIYAVEENYLTSLIAPLLEDGDSNSIRVALTHVGDIERAKFIKIVTKNKKNFLDIKLHMSLRNH